MSRFIFAVSLALLSGCCLFGPSGEPTVRVLRDTIKAMRTNDYERGRVRYSETASINSAILAAKIERLKQAENNAAVFLKEPKPHVLSKKDEKGKK